MSLYLDGDAFTSSPKIDAALDKLRDSFDWDAPRSKWKPATIPALLQHMGVTVDKGTRSVYGRAVSRLNGGKRTYRNNNSIVLLPPEKSAQ